MQPRKPLRRLQKRSKPKMRLDKYLKVSRLIKRRTVANEACNANRVEVNNKPAKAAQEIKPNDQISIRFGDKLTKIKVLSTKETTRKEEATDLYEILES
jgi:ribosomal 50S subunit-recycling heat shock protein